MQKEKEYSERMRIDMTDLQKEILSIFKEVKKICDKYNLRYFAICGTCIGAVRHHGFIPWDDDLDIGMPDVDYKKFYEIAQRELPSNLKVFYTFEKKHNPCLFMKVHDINTTFIELHEKIHPDSYKGVFVDIFPISGVPSQKHDKKCYLRKVDWIIRLNDRRRQTFKSLVSNRSKVTWLFAHLFPVNFWSNKWRKITCAYHFDETQEVGILTNIKKVYDKKCFETCDSCQFENIEIRCPGDWDKYLSKEYGNYMELPPADEQKAHSDGSIID